MTVLAAQVPDVPAAPSTSVNGNNVEISWTAPFAQGSPIVGYKILIR